jgi:peptidoglycan hydrolase-like protein with peptidoglycan-binding domain
MRSVGITGVVALGLLTAACGSNTQQRAATGGLTGLGVGALVGGPVGAIVGVAAGAVGGWAMPEGADTLALNAIGKEKTAASGALNEVGLASSGSSQAPQASEGHLVRDAQSELQREGLYHGRIDGVLGPETKQAISGYQAREGLQQTATLDQDTVERMNLAPDLDRSAAREGTTSGSGGTTPMLSANDVRDRLQSAGYSDVSNVKAQGQRYTARARRGNDNYTLRIDGHTGRVISEQRLARAASTQGEGSTSVAPDSTSTSTETNAGGVAAPNR